MTKELILNVQAEDRGLSFDGPGLSFIGFQTAVRFGLALAAMDPDSALKRVTAITIWAITREDGREFEAVSVTYQDGTSNSYEFEVY